MTAVIDEKSYDNIMSAIEEAKKDAGTSLIVGGTGDKSVGYYVHPTIIETKNPQSITMLRELFGPVLTVYVYDDTQANWSWVDTLQMVESAVEYGLTGSVFARCREDIAVAEDVLTQACGNFYINDKCTGAIVGQQPFGGARKSGTNDKAGSVFNLLRWVSPQTVKEKTVGISTYIHPHML
uniref:Delta-1-pyrroline-5-carboxylate dehydrogenase, mitochondrial n=1 Tax=Lygus hesperus TaxID=30085 RepID=A0A0A9Z3A4_LYGHE